MNRNSIVNITQKLRLFCDLTGVSYPLNYFVLKQAAFLNSNRKPTVWIYSHVKDELTGFSI